MLNLSRTFITTVLIGENKIPKNPEILALILSYNPGSTSSAAYSSSAGALLYPRLCLSGLYHILNLYQ